MTKISFKKFSKIDSEKFKSLNLEWLNRYFKVEPIDELVLNNPKREIIDKGGFIFMIEKKSDIIGTFAFIKKSEKIYEFSKMAIIPDERGNGYGNKAMKFLIQFAKNKKWSRLILYSNTKLKNSIHLYRKYGFKEIPIEKNLIYSRGNIKMELSLIH
ncbi:MAG: GNAT family N-acetyltransferase [Flavobacteriaceae bacterium]|nr:GNAT family N-acetyltransferase [Flavobacteriaceae bacterium]